MDPKLAYLQITHIIPYFCKDELESRQNEFEVFMPLLIEKNIFTKLTFPIHKQQNHDIDTFMFETPFTKNGTARGCVEEQWKRRTILRSN